MEIIQRYPHFPKSSFQKESRLEMIPRHGLESFPQEAGFESHSRPTQQTFLNILPMCDRHRLSWICLQPVCRHSGLQGIKLRKKILPSKYFVLKKNCLILPLLSSRKAFNILQGMLLKSFQPGLCKALQRPSSSCPWEENAKTHQVLKPRIEKMFLIQIPLFP